MIAVSDKTRSSLKIIGIQLIEIGFAVLSMILSFGLAGWLIYDDFTILETYQGVAFYVLASGTGVLILASFKYFNFLDSSFVSTMGKAMFIVFAINMLLIIPLYFFTEVRLYTYFFVIAMAFQYCMLMVIKIFSGFLKHGMIMKKKALVIGNRSEKDLLLKNVSRKCSCPIYFMDINDKVDFCRLDQSDFIYLISSASKEYKQQIITYCELQSKQLFVVPEVHEIALRDSELSRVGDIPLFTIDRFRLTEAQSIIKRMLDIGIAFIGIILTGPILITSAIFIKAEDGGPVFYRQKRVGINRKEFDIWKLRSMLVDAEKYTGTICAMENDPRITRTGAFLRSSRIDEIPQFFNVLRGNMSIVGPRPERPYFVEQFCRENPEYLLRLSVKPGITGLAQVMANYTTTPENKLKFDLFYIKSYSPFLDLRILLKTVEVIFLKNRARGFQVKPVGDEEAEASESSGYKAQMAEGEDGFCPCRKGINPINWLKAALTVLACTLIVFSCVLLRYNPLLYQINRIAEVQGYQILIEEGEVPLDGEPVNVSDPAGEDYSGLDSQTADREMKLQDALTLLFGVVLRMNPDDLAVLEQLAEAGFAEDEIQQAQGLLIKSMEKKTGKNMRALSAEESEQSKEGR